jgi:hypothetical protein
MKISKNKSEINSDGAVPPEAAPAGVCDDNSPEPTWADVMLMIPRQHRAKVLDELCRSARESANYAREAASLAKELEHLRPPPTREEILTRRDAEIVRALAAYDGPATRRARALANDLALATSLKGLPSSETLRAAAEILWLNGGRPLAWRQIQNIADGFRRG